MITWSILQPVVALAAWTMVMWVWLYAKRMPALGKSGANFDELVQGPPGKIDEIVPNKVQWPARNYNHLHEAPTVFYAVALVLAVTGNGGGHGTHVAWAYVLLRVLHSIVQSTINKGGPRFALFALSTLCLMALIFRAAQVVF